MYNWLLDEWAVYLSVTIIVAPGFSVNDSVDIVFLKIETKLCMITFNDVNNGLFKKQ